MRLFYTAIAALLLWVCPFAEVSAQGAKVEAKMDSAAILVGHQTLIRLNLLQPADQPVYRPMVKDTLTKGVELLRVSQPDTVSESNGLLALAQEMLVTSFDSGFYYISPIRYSNGADTIQTEGITLKVETLDVDTTNAEFFDIKPVEQPPFVWGDYLYILWIVLAVALLAAGAVLFHRWYTHRPLLAALQPQEPQLPAHEKALNALNALKAEKLWQNGQEKEYHTRVTDIVRTYLSDRYGVNAMEMTSAEILDAFKVEARENAVFKRLRDIFTVADFVKFAKLRPTEEENEMSLMHAVFFVDQTKEVPAEEENAEASDADANGASKEVAPSAETEKGEEK